VTGLKSPSLDYFDLGDGCAIANSVGQMSAVIHGGGSVTLNDLPESGLFNLNLKASYHFLLTSVRSDY
jgi:hypothetical protein